MKLTKYLKKDILIEKWVSLNRSSLFIKAGAAAGAAVAIYEAGKATGEFIYHITH
jgi:ABC-type uncharacterized transport system substrate-binding protein